jgi:pSer/pThr/pTyr-binding forkhead associated (FHA) protein
VAKLIIYEEIDGADTVFEMFDLSVSRILIGSDPDNHLILEAPDVDAAHASLELRNNAWVLQDLGGPGGTHVNGQRIEGPYPLHHHDLIGLGQIKIQFQEYDNELEPEVTPSKATTSSGEAHPSDRLWFATIAGGTIALIFIILLLLVVADYLGVIKIADLLPPWLVG